MQSLKKIHAWAQFCLWCNFNQICIRMFVCLKLMFFNAAFFYINNWFAFILADNDFLEANPQGIH